MAPNPYDFSSPAREDTFAGRKAETERLRQFAGGITESIAAHLLIHGRRGIGKTSLLTRLREVLDERGLLHATVTLDDGSAEDSVFFSEAVQALETAVVNAGGFGGVGDGYDAAFHMALLGTTPIDNVGPLRVAQSAGRTPSQTDNRIPSAFITADLEDLANEARDLDSAGLVLIVDEADRLQGHAQTIQRMRNLLVLPGVLSCVLVGGDELVSALDGALEAASRHFQRLEVRTLGDAGETYSCMARPLRVAGLDEQTLMQSGTVEDVHELTRGRPYEIALVCHAMYDRLVSGEASGLALSDQVLEEVADQLKPAPEEKAALSILRSLEADGLSLAARYCVDPRLSLQEHAMLRASFEPPKPERLTTERVATLSEWQQLSQTGLASMDGEFIRPAFGSLVDST